MADVENAQKVIQDTVEKVTEVAGDDTGLFIAYTALLLMALIPIYVGSMLSLAPKTQEEKDETMTTNDAAMFPIVASFCLFGLYLVFRFLGKEYINYLLTGYFFVFGVFAMAHVMRPVLLKFAPESMTVPFNISFTKGHKPDVSELFSESFDYVNLAGIVCSIPIAIWYVYGKHWIANNLLAIAFSVNAIEMLLMDSYMVGAILLGGLFFYDIFWVFGTPVMVEVAKSFEAPIKVLFPKDLLENGWAANQCALLGLGDIVIPGIFIALLLRFDRSRRVEGASSFSKPYFWATFVAYIVGLVTTVSVMHVYSAAQPALLYLVPACLGVSMLVAVVRGEVTLLFAYKDSESSPIKESKSKAA
eukprot:CFRG6020T1